MIPDFKTFCNESFKSFIKGFTFKKLEVSLTEAGFEVVDNKDDKFTVKLPKQEFSKSFHNDEAELKHSFTDAFNEKLEKYTKSVVVTDIKDKSDGVYMQVTLKDEVGEYSGETGKKHYKNHFERRPGAYI